MVTEAQKQQFVERGFFIAEDLFDGDEMDAIESIIDGCVEDANDGLKVSGGAGISRPNEIVFTAFLAEKNDVLKEFVKGPKFVDITTGIIGPDVRLYWNQAVYKFPETHKEFPWHQDNGYTPVDPEQYYTCWVALQDATIDNGCVWVLPGSHTEGTLPHADSDLGRVGYDGESDGVAVELKRGSNKLQMLQAISYAGMVSRWSVEDFREKLTGDQWDTLADFLEVDIDEINRNQRLLLVAEGYDYALLAGAEWLSQQHGIDIRCASITIAADIDTDTEYLACAIVFPAPALVDQTTPRGGPVTSP